MCKQPGPLLFQDRLLWTAREKTGCCVFSTGGSPNLPYHHHSDQPKIRNVLICRPHFYHRSCMCLGGKHFTLFFTAAARIDIIFFLKSYHLLVRVVSVFDDGGCRGCMSMCFCVSVFCVCTKTQILSSFTISRNI